MRSVIVQNTASILLGRVGENNTTQVIWENIVSEYRENFGDGSFTLAVKRCGDQSPYFVDITADESNISWLVSGGDVAKAGMGSCELTYTVDGAIAKTQTWSTVVYNSLSADEPTDPPAPVENWVQKVIDASNRAKQSEQSASESAAQAAQDAEAALQNASSSLQNAESALQNAERAEQSASSADEASKSAQEAARRIPVPTLADKGSSLFVGEGDKLVYQDGRGNWQQNDQNSIDYIKNRPGGYDEAKKVRVELWSGTTPAIGQGDGKEFTVPVTTFDQPFSVVIDGVENIYTPIPRTIDGDTLYLFGSLTEAEIDDLLASDKTPDHGYMFMGGIIDGSAGAEFVVFENAYAEKPFSLSIFQDTITPVKIPAKWLENKFIVNVTGPVAGTNGESSTITADHTFAEVVAAHEAGMSVEIHGSFTGFTGIQAICAPVAYVSQQLILCGSSLNFAPLSKEGLYQFTITGTVANEWTLIVNRIDQNAGEHMIIAGAAGSDGEFVPAKTYTATELKQAYDSGTIIDIMVNFSGSSNDGGVLLHLISYNNNSFGWGLVFPFNDSYEDETGTLVNTYTDIIYSVSAEMDLTNNTISWGKKAVLETVSFSDKIKPLQTQVNTNTSDISTLKSRVTTLGNNVKQSNWATNDTSDYSYVQNRPGAYDQYNDTEITVSNNTFTCPSSFIAEDQDILIKFNELWGEGYTFGEMPVLLDHFSEISTNDMGDEITPFYGIRDSFSVSAYQAGTEDYIGAFRYQITIAITSKDDGNGQATGTIEIFDISSSDGGGLSGGPTPSISHIYHRETIHVKIPSKYLESPDIVVKLSLNDSAITQTTSYTANELINAFDAGMDIRAAIFISDVDTNFLIPCIGKQAADSGILLIWGWDTLIITMIVDSSGEVTWGIITDDPTADRLSNIESRLDTVESSVTTAQTTAEEAKTAADRVPASTAADKDKFLRVDASGNPVWQTVPNAEGGSF